MSMAIRQTVRKMCAGLNIPLAGFAPADRWDDPRYGSLVPEDFRPKAIVPETNTVIVLGLPVTLPVLETTPSIWYHELYRTVNRLLDENGYRIALALSAEGHPSVWVPRDGYGSVSILKEKPIAFFSHRHAAFLAGLGNFGISNMLLTPDFGPRVRFVSVFTSAVIEPDPVREEPLCIRCMRCVKACPVHALDGKDYPFGITDKKACATRSEALFRRDISPCGLCIMVCPVGDDRRVFGHEEPELYDEKNIRSELYHRAWKHVRSYGGR
jgi:epoxyqueuosine reductase